MGSAPEPVHDVVAERPEGIERLHERPAPRVGAQLGRAFRDYGKIGAVTFVQRCDASLQLNVHFHTLALDGMYVRDESGARLFHRLPDPTHEEVVQVATWVHVRSLVNPLPFLDVLDALQRHAVYEPSPGGLLG